MKKLILAVLLLTASLFGQTTYNITQTTGTTGTVTDSSGNVMGPLVLTVWDTPVEVCTPGTCYAEQAEISFTAGVMLKGSNVESGGNMNSRGGFAIQVNLANEGSIFSGSALAGGKWTVVYPTNPGGTHYYLFTASVVDASGNKGTVALQTAAIKTPYLMFDKTIAVQSFTIALTIAQ